LLPGSDFPGILLGLDAGDLRQVIQIVHHPSGEQLSEGDDAEIRMPAAARKFCLVQFPSAQLFQVMLTHLSKDIQQVSQGFSLALLVLGEAIERIEDFACPTRQDYLRPWNPVGLFTVDQVTNDIERVLSITTFIRVPPPVGKPA